MKNFVIESNVYGEPSVFTVTKYDENDIQDFKEYFDCWQNLKTSSLKIDGGPANFHAAFTEGLFCLWSGCVRYKDSKSKKLKSSSFDAYDIVTEKTKQVKSTMMDIDLTSFGPKTKWDDLYFLDFYNDGSVDGSFDVYYIENEIIYNSLVNKSETLKEQQEAKRRPRTSVKKNVIEVFNIQPVEKKVKIW
jgi:hypothetical protein